MTHDDTLFVSTLPASKHDRRIALGLALTSLAVLVGLTPFAKEPLAQVWAFIPIYETGLVATDLITAVLLFGQFAILGSRGILLLASAYLFTAAITIAHALTFPGLFAPGGLLGAGPQSTAWLYMFWHAGFPGLILAYALLKDTPCPPPARRAMIGLCCGGVLVAVAACTLVATAGQTLLPPIMAGNHYTPAFMGVVSSVWLVSSAALVALWRKRAHTVLDTWLMAVTCVWLCDIALSAVLNGGRFDLGFYAGRIYGLLSASLLLVILLTENTMLYARLAQARDELTSTNRELDDFAYIASHDLKEPLRGIHNYVGFLQEDYADRLDDEGKHYLERMQRLAERMSSLIDTLLAYSRLGSRPLAMETVDTQSVLGEVREDLLPLLLARNVELRQAGRFPVITGNALRIGEVFQNLVSNAAKYNDKPEKWIEVGCDTTHPVPVFHVRDNGIGIPVEHRENVFRIFKRLHERDKFGGGTGAGLTIVKKIVERHGGRIWVESTPGEGTVFHFTFSGAS
jgi:signal transduction histidine kinase